MFVGRVYVGITINILNFARFENIPKKMLRVVLVIQFAQFYPLGARMHI